MNAYKSAGSDEGQRHGVRRRCRLLPGQQRHRVGGERRKRSPLDASARADDASKRPWHEEPIGDTVRTRGHL